MHPAFKSIDYKLARALMACSRPFIIYLKGYSPKVFTPKTSSYNEKYLRVIFQFAYDWAENVEVDPMQY